MKAVIDSIVGILMLLGLGAGLHSAYSSIQKEALLRVHKGLPSLEKYTQKLTGTKLKN